ncbi:hypothetical protein B0H63DRAFT_538556 [Podospora didyma]|uniref:DUF7580 domain-containing protein n=1 Tax=Podospora didyma TaxID=330526 RepID=A0AAE0NZ59_9PEZI|nr:hypothetical protein B0H63DRAFT_538556 [Podospora didyma]
MSGFEAVGAVLGAFPIALRALDDFREVSKRLRLWNMIGVEHVKCRNDIEFHRVNLASNVRQLVLPLLVDDEKTNQLLSDPGGPSWQEPEIKMLLRDRLGETYDLYLSYIQGLDQAMGRLNKELLVDDASIQDTLKIALTRMRSGAIMSKDEMKFQLYKVKFSNGEAIRKDLFAQLQDYNQKLEKLLSTSDRDAQLTESRQQTKSSTDMTLCNIWAQASRCACKDQKRCANLLLQHRTSKNSDFDILFATSAGPSDWKMKRVRISDLATTQLSGPPNTDTSIQPILSLCLSLQQKIDDQKCCGYLTEDVEGCRYYVPTVSGDPFASFPPSLAHDQILKGANITRKQRYLLSLILAPSFVQLLDTPWMHVTWKKADIFFLQDASSPNRFGLDQPHLSHCESLDKPPETGNVPNLRSLGQSLDQLGIVLLELCFGKALEDQACRKQWGGGRYDTERSGFDTLAAREWMDEVEGEAGLEYFEAVSWCLRGRITREQQWRHDMLRCVVEPLQRYQYFLIKGFCC